MKVETFYHSGADVMSPRKVKTEVLGVLKRVKFNITRGCSDNIRQCILQSLQEIGWSDEFKIDAQSQITLPASKDSLALCFQTGNTSRFYADMLKLQYVYMQKGFHAAIYILYSKEAAKIIGSNVANFDRFVFEINLFKDIVSIPILVIGIK